MSNPIVISSNNFSDSLDKILKMFDYGAQIVVTKTICNEESLSGKIVKKDLSLFNTTMYSQKTFDQWLSIISKLVRLEKNIVPSIFARNEKEIVYMAKSIEALGVSAIELGGVCPNDTGSSSIHELASAIINETNLKLSVKLTADQNYLEQVSSLSEKGISTICISDALKASSIVNGKIEEMGYSGASIKPIVLHAINEIRQNGYNGEIIGVGGVLKNSDIEDYLAVGANAIGLCSSLYFYGLKSIQSLSQYKYDYWR